MRDQEFLEALKVMQPIIGARFARLIRSANIKDDRESLKKDLIQVTIFLSLRNSRLPQNDHINCRQLIKEKAKNVWAEYYHQFKNSFNHPNHKDIDLEWKEENNPSEDSGIMEKIQWIIDEAKPIEKEIINKRLEGFSNGEIGNFLDKSEASITMHLQRLKKRLLNRRH